MSATLPGLDLPLMFAPDVLGLRPAPPEPPVDAAQPALAVPPVRGAWVRHEEADGGYLLRTRSANAVRVRRFGDGWQVENIKAGCTSRRTTIAEADALAARIARAAAS